MIAELSLLIIFIAVWIVGAYIIYRQVALIKKGDFSIKDILKCIFYGLVFSFAVMVVMGMAFIFAVNSPDLWQGSSVQPENIHPFALLIPLFVCLLYITIYPLIDFLYLAQSSQTKEGLTVFHKILGKTIINRFDSKIKSFAIAIAFYFGVFLAPPFLLSLLGIPLILLWSTWFLVYPLMILTYYGAKGFIAGISDAYLHIPNMNRSLFVGIENPKRATREFLDDPVSRILIGMMLFVFIWQWISSVQTILFLFKGEMGISPYSYSGMVFLTLLFGVIGYFTRFWGRKIQYRAIDIYFAAYLMAAVGINVFVNFLIVNITKLRETLNVWFLTAPITDNFLLFAIPAVIEEIVLILFTSYYFLARESTFNINYMHSKITECGQTFDPIPLFNLLKSKNSKLRNHAEQTLFNMYERIPLKIDIDIHEIKYKYPLLDGLSSSDKYIRQVCANIMNQLERDFPEEVLPWIVESLSSPNYEKSITMAKTLLDSQLNLLQKIPKVILFKLINDYEWHLRYILIKVLKKLLLNKHVYIENMPIKKLLKDPDVKVQVEVLNMLNEYTSYSIPIEILQAKINHDNRHVRAAAIKTLKNVTNEEIKDQIIPLLIPHMKDPSNLVRASIFELFSNLKNIKKYSLPMHPLYNALESSDSGLRNAAILVIQKYHEQKPSAIDVDEIIKKINDSQIDNLIDILNLLGGLWTDKGHFWNKDPEKILNIFLRYLKFNDANVKDMVTHIIINKYDLNPDIIFQTLVEIPDTSRFILKGHISQTLIKLAEKYPDDVIPRLSNFKSFEKKEAQINALSALEEIAEKYPEKIELSPFISVLKGSNDPLVKNQCTKILTQIAKVNPKAVESILPEISLVFENQEPSVKIAIAKSLLHIAQQSPQLIDKKNVIDLLSEDDSFIRETATKILGEIGTVSDKYEEIIDTLLKNALVDQEWIVRESAITSVGRILTNIKDKSFIIEKLIPLLDDNKPWVRRSVLNLLSDIEELSISQIPLDKIYENIDHESAEIREATAKLLRKYENENIERIFNKIISLLEDPFKQVRNKMIISMIDIIRSKGLESLLPELLKYLSDEYSLELQRSIATLLERVAKYEKEEIKERIISVLEIRCNMSQDQIICRALHNLKTYL